MKWAARHRVLKILPAVLLTVLLGAQTLQAAHFHADHLGSADCLQCQTHTGQAAVSNGSLVLPTQAAGGNHQPAIALAPVSTHYRLAARGPPALSC
jgi:hypothetical protein